MLTTRLAAHAPRTEDLAREVTSLNSPCIGCTDCQGICRNLIELLCLPEVVLKDRAV